MPSMDDHKTLREKAEEYGDGKPICMKKELLKLRLEYIKKAEGIMKEKAIPLGSVAEMRKRRELDRMEEISPQEQSYSEGC